MHPKSLWQPNCDILSPSETMRYAQDDSTQSNVHSFHGVDEGIGVSGGGGGGIVGVAVGRGVRVGMGVRVGRGVCVGVGLGGWMCVGVTSTSLG